MPLLLLLLIGGGLFLIIKYIGVIVTVAAIIISGITVITLACVWMGTSYCLRKSGYRRHNAKQACQQVGSGLNQITGDLAEIRSQLNDVVPYLRDMEFLRYARQNPKVEN